MLLRRCARLVPGIKHCSCARSLLQYGQGMSVAACGAKVLDAALGRALSGSTAGTAQREEGLARLAVSFQKELFAVISRAWTMASSEDARQVIAQW